MQGALRSTPYAKDITYTSSQLSQVQPAIVLHADSASELHRQVVELRDDLSRIAAAQKRPFYLWYLYGRDDCTHAIDDALYAATQDAITKARGEPIRYLQETSAEDVGTMTCMRFPTMRDDWSQSDALPEAAGTEASVTAGY